MPPVKQNRTKLAVTFSQAPTPARRRPQLLHPVALEEGGALQRTQLRANANLRQVIEGRLAEIRVGCIATIEASVEPAHRDLQVRAAVVDGRFGTTSTPLAAICPRFLPRSLRDIEGGARGIGGVGVESVPGGLYCARYRKLVVQTMSNGMEQNSLCASRSSKMSERRSIKRARPKSCSFPHSSPHFSRA